MPEAPHAGPRQWLGLAVLSLPCLLYSMDLTVLHLAVPQLSADLRPTSAELLWIIDIYGFLVAGSLITMGTLGDRIGRRRLLLIGAAAFGAASLLAAFATSVGVLIAARAVLGLAGATVAPSTLSLIRTMFQNDAERTKAIGIWITNYSVGSAIGPLIGGLMLEHFWWGSVFLIALPIMALLLILGPLVLPEYRDPAAGRLDLPSAALSLGAVLSVIWGLKILAQDGFSPVPLLSVAAGSLLGTVFVRRQLSLADPLIDLRLFKLPGFSASLVVYGLSIITLMGGFLFIPQTLQLVVGQSPLESGLWTLPWALAFIAGSLVTPTMLTLARPGSIMVGGLLLSAAGFALLTRFDGAATLPLFVVASVAFAFGMAPLFTLITDLIIGRAPQEQAGAAAAVSETSAEFGAALGIAVFGSIGVAVYRTAVGPALPSGLAPDAAQAALNTLSGALNTAASLPDGAGLASAAKEAFMRGLHLTAVISAAGSLALAGFTWATLRDEQSAGERAD